MEVETGPIATEEAVVEVEIGGAAVEVETEGAAAEVEIGGAAAEVEIGGAAMEVEIEGAAVEVETGGAAVEVEIGGAAVEVEIGGAAVEAETKDIKIGTEKANEEEKREVQRGGVMRVEKRKTRMGLTKDATGGLVVVGRKTSSTSMAITLSRNLLKKIPPLVQ